MTTLNLIPSPIYPAELDTRRRSEPPVAIRRRAGRTGSLVVACILDEFSFNSFNAEADLAPLTIKNWRAEITAAQPDLLLVESAWRGHRQTWWNTVHRHGPELTGIVEWCKERGIPTAFWNKEDPVHFNTFLTTAGMFDAVFTTDLDCVPRYKKELGHENVHFLPFAAQPAESNPLEVYNRIDGCAFAGAYYEKYPERLADLAELSKELGAEGRRFDIYDRNHGKDMPGYMFPEEYEHLIVGGALTPDMLDIPYKGYTTNLNMNSVKQSQSMFARRVFELMASNTLVVSNFSRGLRLMFGDLVVATDSGMEMRRRLDAIDAEPNGNERLRAMALRKVLREHTYAERLEFIATQAGVALPDAAGSAASIAVIATVKSLNDYQTLQKIIEAQTYREIALYPVVDNAKVAATLPNNSHPNIQEAIHSATENGDAYISSLSVSDWYGPEYFADMIQTFRWADVHAVGHVEHYAATKRAAGTAIARRNQHSAFSLQHGARLTRSLVKADDFAEWWESSRNSRVEDATGPVLAVGTSQYCFRGNGLSISDLAPCSDLSLDTGYSLTDLRNFAQSLQPDPAVDLDLPQFDLVPYVDDFTSNERAQIIAADGRVTLKGNLEPGKHVYLTSTRDHDPERFATDGSATVYLDASTGLDAMLVIYYLDNSGTRIAHDFVKPRVNTKLSIPSETATCRLGWRIAGDGEATVKSFYLASYSPPRRPLITRAETLVVTNVYPTYDNLYRNGFVHSRTRAYLDRGQRTDVARVSNYPDSRFAEFEDIDTAWIDPDTFAETINTRRHKRLLIHFLERAMWQALEDANHLEKVLVWVHGAEVQPWWRRAYNYSTTEELEAAKPASDARLAFWREVFTRLPDNFHFIFVSQYFADEVFEDVGITLPAERYTIIHNPIDTDIFTYVEKLPEQAKKVLTIRPYASAKYANDLSVKAVLHLKDRPGFEDIAFMFIGDGPLFDDTLAPLRDLPNVTIQKGFLTHPEIAKIHKDYGVFLTPTRMDAQGVSRDEAMSSGLVPISSAVAAIPEFVDHEVGFLAEGEDYMGLADGIWSLAQDTELFARLSKAAARRVRIQTASEVILPLEIDLIWGTK